MRILLFTILLLCTRGYSQSEKADYLAITFENDAISLPGVTDHHYTNGIRLERMGPRYVQKNYLLNKILIKKKERKSVNNTYGSFFGQNMYTPVHIDCVNVQSNDRPFSGWLYGGVKCLSTDTSRRARFTSELYIGIIGPYAFAGETQTFIHKISNSTIPQGWPHQIDSDLGINYVFRVEQMINPLSPKPVVRLIRTDDGHDEFIKSHFEVLLLGEVNAGTVFNNLALGTLIRAGYMTPYFSSYNFSSGPIIKILEDEQVNEKAKRQTVKTVGKFMKTVSQAFLFVKPQVRAIVYNAMLQGGLLNKNSDYVIKNDDVNRVFVQLDYGLGLTFKSITLTYYQSIRTKEFSFSSRNNHYWGGLNLIFNY